jgi:hypothetical protein
MAKATARGWNPPARPGVNDPEGKTMRRRASLAGVLAAAVLAAGCLVEIEKVDDPGAAFARARAEVGRVQGRPGRPGHLEVLVYDRAERQLVRASLPMWLVHKMDDGDDVDLDFGDEGGEAARRVRGRLRLEDIEKAGRGLLVEVEEEDGDQVLVWLR